MKRQNIFLKSWNLLKDTFLEFNEDNAIKLSASLSYYTLFALPPLLIIIITICGFFFGEEAVTGELYGQINRLVGNDAAIQIQEAIKNVQLSDSNVFITVFGVVMLLIGASGVFAEIQSSINFIWGLRAKPNKGLKKFIQNRIMSFSMIASVGFLMLVSLMLNTVLDLLNSRLKLYFPESTVYLFYVINLVLVLASITLLFAIIFRTLPDGVIKWKDAFIGASCTAALFMIGKFAIGFYLGSSTIASVYGAAGSVIIILVWVYYSAIILYFGAEFTKVYAKSYGGQIVPNEYSVEIKKEIFEIKE
ncbi:YihY/virulence factor BrkB family protein [Flavobacterium sp. Fl-318]|uniref:YihY/virulence factor BrkB family protein n=1 Tax=Flavobacterium cupriresistens TaxID=2893885 RepID=A0ABU4R6P0_9FLAO|nr:MULTISPECIES: YihY/virulence factor BrkB family protein [unclassified Flavobacterium]MDX6188249.1 YihY/virulence factor BrkB family protein [Flavobacterium sp. Fl-318]UFH40710.1 YihY/virulence factor BrkB family protein [Flavobacterium sp. F-323]